MIIAKLKPLAEILKYIKQGEKLFLVGCGECATTCKSGGEEEVLAIKKALEKEGITITGYTVPEAPCVAAKLRGEFAKHQREIKDADSMLVLACGLGAQSVKENDRFAKVVHIACDTLFMGAVDKEGVFKEKCSACGECVLELTGGICPITLCAKGILNGPCGGANKGKCEVDKERDCAWVLIYNELKKQGNLSRLREIQPPKDYSKTNKPRQLNQALSASKSF
ncbi:MAG: methylenetetrahydrofolate reductase C-terminal domain-containing protein [Candidatus Omnitrophica bacterium]|nr:methylenetetrahydrofolate reductase C-terminal domain-containing protein [Candidatus Omnitrophota bacterium]